MNARRLSPADDKNLLTEHSPLFPSGLDVLVLEGDGAGSGALLDALHALGISQVTRTADLPASDRFDIVLFDLDDERMDGIEFIRRSAERESRALIPMSSRDDELLDSVLAFARSHRVNLPGILPKPVALRDLASLLARCGARRPAMPHGDDGPPHREWRKADLEKALDLQQFIPFFQPQIELATGHVTSVEVLARWNHPESGLLPPSQFIDIMERTGLIDRLFETVLRQSLDYARQWDACGFPIGLAINVSPVTLQNPELSSRAAAMVRQHGMHPDRITLEVTETAMTQDPARLLETVLRLRLCGFKLSVDDFGTGYSTLQQLSEIPFTEIKIDRELVTGASGSRKSAVILESVIALANRLGMCTVAEGIQSKQDHDLIRSLGCRFGQAYYFARPMGNTDLVRLLACV